MKKVCAFICASFAFALLLLTACSQNQDSTSQTLDPQNTLCERNSDGVVVTDSGIYYCTLDYDLNGSPGIIKYYDFDTKTILPLCSDPSCDHTDYEHCNALFEYRTDTLLLNKKTIVCKL